MIYLELFIGFFKVGCLAFGGAYGAIPLIRDTVLSYEWLEEETLTYIIAVSESTPGPIIVNLATYIGSNQGGIMGAAISTFAVIIPSFVIVLLIMVILKRILSNKYIQTILRGLKPSIIGIVLAAGISMMVHNCKYTVDSLLNLQALYLTGILMVVLYGTKKFRKKKVSPIILIIISAIAGVIAYGM